MSQHIEESHAMPITFWMAVLVFVWLHVPTSIQRDTPLFSTYDEVAPASAAHKETDLLRVAEETLNSGLTPLLGLKTYQLVNEGTTPDKKEKN